MQAHSNSRHAVPLLPPFTIEAIRLAEQAIERDRNCCLAVYQIAYTSESLAAQIKNPQDRLQLVGKQIADAVGAKR